MRSDGGTELARVVYGVMSHGRTDQVLRLCARIRKDVTAPVIIHHDPTVERLHQSDVSHLSDIVVVNDPIPVVWSDFTALEATLKLFQEATAKWDFDYFVLLSGQHYPLRHLAGFHRHLAAKGGDGLLAAVEVRTPARWGHWRRIAPNNGLHFYYRYYSLRHVPLAAIKALRAVAREVEPLACVRLPNRNRPGKIGFRTWRPPGGLRPLFGSQWIALSKSAVAYVLDVAQHRPHVLNTFKYRTAPDETMIQTLIWNEPSLSPRQEATTFVDWPAGSSSPKVLTSDDIDQLRATNLWFARKFDIEVDTEVLNMLDSDALTS